MSLLRRKIQSHQITVTKHPHRRTLKTPLALIAAASLSIAAVPPERAVVNQYCIGCHNSKSKAAGLALDADDSTRNPDTWEKVVRKLRARYMPPAGLPRPDEKTYDAVVSSLEASLDKAAAAHPNPGRTDTFRRAGGRPRV